MSRLHRPYVPLSVRVQVAKRQLRALDEHHAASVFFGLKYDSDKRCLSVLLTALFGEQKFQLDHDPALENRRQYRRRVKGELRIFYDPPANDPEHLVYREKHAHQIKTNVRGDGAKRSDREERAHQKALDRNRGRRPKKKARPIAKRKEPLFRTLEDRMLFKTSRPMTRAEKRDAVTFFNRIRSDARSHATRWPKRGFQKGRKFAVPR